MDTLVQQTRGVRQACFQSEASLMAELAEGQHPTMLYIGCADSRILPSHILNAQPGTVFTMRNIANIVPSYEAMQRGEMAVAAVLEYAILHLKVTDVIVCGHSSCGGIQALLHGHGLEPALDNWLAHARAVLDQVPADLAKSEHLDALIEANVVLQLEHLRSYPFIAEAEREGSIRLHGWVYDLTSERVRSFEQSDGCFLEELPLSAEV